jgi:hypothetical protein
MKRYKYCSKPVKCYRWLRYKPLFAIVASYHIICWLATRAKTNDFMPLRMDMLKMIWQCSMSMADIQMRNYLTLQELISELKDRIDESKQMA